VPRGRIAWKQPGDRVLTPDGYVLVYTPGHPRAHRGYVLEHVLVAERALGKYLPPRAVVHHVNEQRPDNRPTNLVVCENQAYHLLLHARARVLEDHHLGGKVCLTCKVRRPFKEFSRSRSRFDGLNPHCRSCDAARKREALCA
jgi:hypothetical protein